jgi:tetratricopeptide (TPR) repeat protein
MSDLLLHGGRAGMRVFALLLAGAVFGGTSEANAAAAEADRFEELSRAVVAMPEDMLKGNTLRRVCREQKIFERCIDLFDRLAADHPAVAAVRFNAALAYVDNLPNHSLYMQARFSTHSMDHVSAILQADPDNWLAFYIRGLNSLYWPLWYRRTERAIADLSRCIQISESLPAQQRQPFMALAYVALGDTYARLDRIEEARKVWAQGESEYSSALLHQRLAAEPHTVHEAIEKVRSRDVPIDTDLRTFAVNSGGGNQ